MKEEKQMFNADKLAAQVATLATARSEFNSEIMKRFIYSVLINAEKLTARGDEQMARGLEDFIGMVFINIYNFNPDDGKISVAASITSEFFENKVVKSSEVAAHCMAMMKHCHEFDMETESEYVSGVLVGIASMADILSFEMMGGRPEAERSSDGQ
jgi:hypothetical protein